MINMFLEAHQAACYKLHYYGNIPSFVNKSLCPTNIYGTQLTQVEKSRWSVKHLAEAYALI